MNITILLLSIFCAFIALFIVKGYASKKMESSIVLSGLLPQCESKPNCTCSEYFNDTKHFISPLEYSLEENHVDSKDIIQILNLSLEEIGGVIISGNNTHINAIFTSHFFRFVDDVNVRIDKTNKVIHFRSKSRVGHSDFGANKSRIEQLKEQIKINLNK